MKLKGSYMNKLFSLKNLEIKKTGLLVGLDRKGSIEKAGKHLILIKDTSNVLQESEYLGQAHKT